MAIGALRGRSNGGARAKHVAASAQRADDERTRRFHEAASPHLNDLYTLARYLMRNPDDAEDAVQECYLRGLRYFDSYRGPAMKPWLLAILRNICMSEFKRRGKQEPLNEYSDDESVGESMAKWQEPQAPRKAHSLRSTTPPRCAGLLTRCHRRSAKSSFCAK
jgi:RNA polymerase sigma-70 factor (ECF subfamily)